MVRKNLAFGLNKGFITTSVSKSQGVQNRKLNRKRRISKRVAMVRNVIRTVSGFNPYESKMIELLKEGSQKSLKKTVKLARKRLGSHHRALKKKENMEKIVAQMRKK